MECLEIKLRYHGKKCASNPPPSKYNMVLNKKTSCCLYTNATSVPLSGFTLLPCLQNLGVLNLDHPTQWFFLFFFSSDPSQWVKDSVYWNKSQTQGRNWFLGDPPLPNSSCHRPASLLPVSLSAVKSLEQTHTYVPQPLASVTLNFQTKKVQLLTSYSHSQN
jgi:hypothetical protein